MNKIYTHLTILLASILLSALSLIACTDENQEQADSEVPVSFTTVMGHVVTRSTLDNIWPNSTDIKVRRSKTGETPVVFDYVTAATSSAASSGVAVALTPKTDADKFYWPINNPSWQFDAWPAAFHDTENGGPITTMTVVADQSVYHATNNPSGIKESVYEGYDLLYCLPFTATYRQTVPLAFQHLMARVVVIVNSSSTDQHEQVTNIAFGGGHVGLAGSVNLTTDPVTWTLTGGQTSTVAKMRNKTTKEEKQSHIYTFECILPPQSYATSGELIVITTTGDGSPRTYKYSNSYTLEPGNQYTYSLAISESGKIVVSTVQVMPWETSTVSNTATYGNNYPSTIVTETE